MFLRSLLLAAPLMVAAPAAAQTEHDLSSWTNITVQGAIDDDLVYFVEAQPRVQQDISHLDQLLLRGAVGVKVTPRLTLYQGYLHVVLPISGGRDRNEDRPFQQATWLIPVSHGELTSRTRFEQRILSTSNDVGLRLREMLRYELPVRNSRVRPLASVEGFANLKSTDWGARSGFDQLRTFAGAEVTLFDQTTAELGYMNQWTDGAGSTTLNHIASVSVFFRL